MYAGSLTLNFRNMPFRSIPVLRTHRIACVQQTRYQVPAMASYVCVIAVGDGQMVQVSFGASG